MRPLACLIAAGLLAVAAVSARAMDGYGVAYDTLYGLDLERGQAQEIGPAGRYAGSPIANLSGLSMLEDGRLYAIAGAQKLLLRVDAASGAGSVVAGLQLDTDGGGQHGGLDLNMTAACDGGLWLVSAAAQRLWKVDPGSGKATAVGGTGAALTGLAMHRGTLYGAGGRGDNRLYRLDPASGQARVIGSFGSAAPSWITTASLASDGHTLWAVLSYVPPGAGSSTVADWADLARVDPASGQLEMIGPLTGPESLRQMGMKGFALGPPSCAQAPAAGQPPVPLPLDAPWALGLLAALMALAARRSQRRVLR